MTDYYFLASFLPQLEMGLMPSIDFSELKELLVVNLNQGDLKKVRKLFELIDIENLRALWAHEPIDYRGNYTKEELEEAIATQRWPMDAEFAPYLQDFLASYQTNEARLKHFSLLLSQFLDHDTGDKFLNAYFHFERQLRLVIAAFRAKKIGSPIEKQLQYEDPSDLLVAQILAQKDAPVYEPPFEYKELKPIFTTLADSPIELHKALYEYRFDYLQELANGNYFTIDYILSYAARLLMVKRWLEIDVQKGIEIVDIIEKEIR